MLNFIQTNYVEIATVIVAIIAIVVALRNGEKDKARKEIYDLVLQAEKEIVGTKVGQERLSFVLNAIKTRYPILKFVSNDVITKMIEDAFEFANDYLDNGILDNSVEEKFENTLTSNIVITSPDTSSVTSSDSTVS